VEDWVELEVAMTRSRLAICLTLAVATIPILARMEVARAQDENPTTPGAIADPSTYQGSQALQQQSDAQDQAFRAQQQPVEPQQYYHGAQPDQRYASGGQSRAPEQVAPTKLSSDPAIAAYQRGDYAAAFRLARPRALSGNATWEAKLGFLYERGLGTPRNPALAVDWYRKAADQGDSGAQTNLGYMLFVGHQGVPQDRIEGYKWLLLGGRQSAHARSLMQQFRPSLTYEELSEATQRYGMWTPSKSGPPSAASPPPLPHRHHNR
jgi:hypothetical protein